jgi:acid phosphatase type 7
VVVSARAHSYERFAPQRPDGTLDPERGIRQFVMDTGGDRAQHGFGAVEPNSRVRKAGTPGVLKLILNPASYEWRFVPVAGETFADSGTAECH